MSTLTFKVHLARQERGKVELREGAAPTPPAPVSIPSRVARLVALAHHIEGLVRAGKLRDYAQVAALGGITRARVSQLTNLLLLAPDIQERLLDLKRPATGRELLGEKELRDIALIPDWNEQRRRFDALLARMPASSHTSTLQN